MRGPPSPPSSPQPPGLPRPSGRRTPSRLSPTSLRCPRGATPPPGPSVSVVAAPFPRPFLPWVSAAASVSRLPRGGRGRARGVWVRGSVLPRGSPRGPARLRPPVPGDSPLSRAPVRRGGPAPGTCEGWGRRNLAPGLRLPPALGTPRLEPRGRGWLEAGCPTDSSYSPLSPQTLQQNRAPLTLI